MADYFPLIARAVAALSPNTRDQRNALYDRARKTLAEKLSDPTLQHADPEAERAALEAAIQSVEMDAMRRAAPPRPPQPPPRPGDKARPAGRPAAHPASSAGPATRYRDIPPLTDTRKPLRIVAGALAAALVLGAGFAIYQYWPRTLSEVRTIATPKSVAVPEQEDAKSDYVRLRQLVYFRTSQPVGTIMVDKSQTFLYVIRPNMSALRYNVGIGTECSALAGLYHVVRKEEQTGDSARALYLDKNSRIHGSDPSAASRRSLPDGCIRLVNDDVIYLYDRTPLESRVVVAN
jgi:lipoprotein-anchoring transpeptidase ErfK/SrfK